MTVTSEQSMQSAPPRAVVVTLLLLSVAMLMFEILQTITLSLQTLERNAFLVISMCLLGLGGGGSIATFMARRSTLPGIRLLWLCSVAFGGLIAVSMILSSRTNAMFWLIVLGVVPYIPVGVFLSVVFRAWPAHANRLYCVNLTGSALGCLVLVWLVNGTGSAVITALIISLLSVSGAATLSRGLGRSSLYASITVAVLLVVVALAGRHLYRYSPAPSKGMALIVNDDRIESEVVWSRWGYLGRLDVVHVGDGIDNFPLGGEFMQRLVDSGCKVDVLFASGGNWTKAVDFQDAPEQRDRFARYSRHSVAYLLTESPDVLNIGFGGGVDIFLSLWHGAKSVVGVDINPLMVTAGRQALPGYFNDFYNDPRVEIHVMDGRTYASNTERKFDVVSLTAVDTGELLHQNAHVLLENYLYTQEAFDDYFRVLKDDGFLYVSRPETQSLRVAATAVRSLRKIGATDPVEHFVILGTGEIGRGRWRSVLVSKKPLTPEQRRTAYGAYHGQAGYIAGFATSERSFANFFAAVAEGREESYIANHQVDFSPVSDNKPFFYEFERDFGDSFASQVLRKTLAWVVGIATVLIVVPLLFVRLPKGRSVRTAVTVVLYFASIGLGFMFVEIGLIQKLVLFLGHPSYSVTVTLFSILVFSGVGSIMAQRLDIGSFRTPLLIWVPILLAILLYFGGLDRLLRANHHDALWVRIVLAALLLAPGSLFMGMPFPTMIRTMARDQALIPWAWAINAFTSVAASVLTVYLAMQSGFQAVFLVGAAAYVVAALVYTTRIRSSA